MRENPNITVCYETQSTILQRSFEVSIERNWFVASEGLDLLTKLLGRCCESSDWMIIFFLHKKNEHPASEYIVYDEGLVSKYWIWYGRFRFYFNKGTDPLISCQRVDIKNRANFFINNHVLPSLWSHCLQITLRTTKCIQTCTCIKSASKFVRSNNWFWISLTSIRVFKFNVYNFWMAIQINDQPFWHTYLFIGKR